MNRRARLAVAGLMLAAILAGAGLVAFASIACPGDLPGQPCPAAGTNRALVVTLAALTAGLLVTPFAFLAEFALRRRIVYRGSWGRAARRGLLVAAVVVAIGGLRLGGALSVPGAMLVVLLAAIGEWFAVRRLDQP